MLNNAWSNNNNLTKDNINDNIDPIVLDSRANTTFHYNKISSLRSVHKIQFSHPIIL